MNNSTRCFVKRCLFGLRGRLYHLVDKVVRAGIAYGSNNSKHNNNYNRRRWDVKSEGISRNNIPRLKVNEWEKLVGELMWYGYIKNHKKTVKNKQAWTRERKSEQKPEAKPGKVKPLVKMVKSWSTKVNKTHNIPFSPSKFF
ncbi:hypothetical protein Tco_1111454 [Tanacetum coccineum]|uniref:Uncharacterized protein n=1 Tax=Tanacetum coccineum TaxID=301880 RepID=A0ABQ5IMY3_9ASTR